MTEQEWLECTDPAKMLCVFRGRLRNGYNRKIRLFACACCRRIWKHLVDERSRNAVEIAERHADEKATDDELKIALTAARHAHREVYDRIGKAGACMEWAAAYAADAIPFHGAMNVSWMAATPRSLEIRTKRPSDWSEIRLVPCTISKRSEPLSLVLGKWKVTTRTETEATGAEKPVQIVLLHDIFGNPFHPVTIDPEWLTPNVVAVAHGIYDERAFDRLPILATTLEEAGCTNADILNHCRSEGQHVRGCWVVDMILGKQ